MADEIADQVLFHGTTLTAAEGIVAAGAFRQEGRGNEMFFALERELAEIFARRKVRRLNGRGTPAIVRVVMDGEDFDELRTKGHIKVRPFDDAGLRGKIQYIFDNAALDHLNRLGFHDEWRVERMDQMTEDAAGKGRAQFGATVVRRS